MDVETLLWKYNERIELINHRNKVFYNVLCAELAK